MDYKTIKIDYTGDYSFSDETDPGEFIHLLNETFHARDYKDLFYKILSFKRRVERLPELIDMIRVYASNNNENVNFAAIKNVYELIK